MYEEDRKRLAQDNDAHWYIIPEEKDIEWGEFLELDSDDPISWDVPEWAQQIDNPFTVTFENPREN